MMNVKRKLLFVAIFFISGLFGNSASAQYGNLRIGKGFRLSDKYNSNIALQLNQLESPSDISSKYYVAFYGKGSRAYIQGGGTFELDSSAKNDGYEILKTIDTKNQDNISTFNFNSTERLVFGKLESDSAGRWVLDSNLILPSTPKNYGIYRLINREYNTVYPLTISDTITNARFSSIGTKLCVGFNFTGEVNIAGRSYSSLGQRDAIFMIFDTITKRPSYVTRIGSTGDDVMVQANVSIGGEYSFYMTMGGDVSIGNIDLTTKGGSDVLLVKLLENGKLVYATNIGGAGNDSADAYVVEPGGNFHLSGRFLGASLQTNGKNYAAPSLYSGMTPFLIKMDRLKPTVTQIQLFAEDMVLTSVALDYQLNIIIAGTTQKGFKWNDVEIAEDKVGDAYIAKGNSKYQFNFQVPVTTGLSHASPQILFDNNYEAITAVIPYSGVSQAGIGKELLETGATRQGWMMQPIFTNVVGIHTVRLKAKPVLFNYSYQHINWFEAGISQLYVYNTTGQLVANQSNITGSQTLNAPNLQPGIYLISYLKSGQYGSTKIVVE